MTIKEKIHEIEDLPGLLAPLRGSRRIVQCHGVFDLLHLGHVRHFEAAKAHGDVLVVTITPDIYVNKGPSRPVFTEALRAEAVAALEVVDYVAVSRWPMAVEAIRTVQPNYYVKGSDYRQADKDHTGGILLEQEAVEACGGQLVFTDDITFSSSHLLNAHMSKLPRDTDEFLTAFRKRHTVESVLAPLINARDLKVLVLGEAIIDEYQYCEAIGKSSKEPIIALRHLSTEKFAGGALAVANHIASFSDHVRILTFLGSENSQEEFIRQSMNEKIEQTYLARSDSPTIVKRRFVESYFFSKMLEIYEMNPRPLTVLDEEALCGALDAMIDDYDLVLVFDFGHGMMCKRAIDLVCSRAKFLAVNAQSNAANLGYHAISKYPRADFVCIAENEMRLEARDRDGDLNEMILNVAAKLSAQRIITTRGKSGCLSYTRGEGFLQAPSLAQQVVDRMGAGDAFLSITALCVAQDVPAEVVAFIGNAAGAHAVATVGHRTSVQRASFFKHIESLMK